MILVENAFGKDIQMNSLTNENGLVFFEYKYNINRQLSSIIVRCLLLYL